MREPAKDDRSTGVNPVEVKSGLTNEELTSLFAELRAPQDVGPRPGFYARVMERIEQQQPNSIWSAFLEPVFGKRIAVAALALAVLLAVFVAMNPAGDEEGLEVMAETPTWYTHGVPAEDRPAPVLSSSVAKMDPEQGREVVFANLVTYQEH